VNTPDYASGAGLVDGTLGRWARAFPDRPAIVEGGSHLRFDELARLVARRATALVAARAPEAVLVEEQGSTAQRLVDYLGIVRSGRCAAVADPDWPEPVRTRVRQFLPAHPSDAREASGTSPFYIGYTSGSTGYPKGFMRDHRSWVESFRACLEAFGPAAAGTVLAPGGLSHSLFLFGMLLGLWTGGGVVVQPRFSAAGALSSLDRGEASCLVAVPTQVVTMLDYAKRRALAPMASVRLVMISGARWMRQRTPELRALFPQARIVEFYGASETSFVAWMDADENAPPSVVGRPFDSVQVDVRDRSGADPAGMIFVRSPMLFSGYVGAEQDPTAAVRDDDGWLSVRDMGYLDAEGRLCLVGRQNRMIVTSGKNVFSEEVEAVLEACPGVRAASLQGVADALRGMSLLAVLSPDPAMPTPDADSLTAWCRGRLESYKLPRRFLLCANWPLTPSGKTDHAALARTAQDWKDEASPRLDAGNTPWLQVLR
jgi:long-chain acyl-CoA synthetase